MTIGASAIGAAAIGGDAASTTPPSDNPVIILSPAALIWVLVHEPFEERSVPFAVVTVSVRPPLDWTYLLPVRLLPSYTFDGTNLSFDIADLVGVSAAEAHATTGDWRDVTQGLMMRVQAYIDSVPFSSRKNCLVTTTDDFTHHHATLGTVLHRTAAVQFAFQYADAYIPDEA